MVWGLWHRELVAEPDGSVCSTWQGQLEKIVDKLKGQKASEACCAETGLDMANGP